MIEKNEYEIYEEDNYIFDFIYIFNIYSNHSKNKIAKIFNKINVVSFFMYYFGFLIYWDYLAITNKDYVLIIFSLLAWIGRIFATYRKYLKLK